MSRWFRFYDEVLNDSKVQRLPPDLFKAWVNLLCIASKNDGRIPVDDVAFGLRMSPDDAAGAMIAMNQAGLIVAFDGYYMPHNWLKRQYKSDVTDPTAANRQQRYRNKHRNATVTVTPTRVRDRADTERKKEARKRALPENFERDLEAPTKAGLSNSEGDREWEKFKNHAKQNGRTCVEWQAAWRNWCLKAAEFLGRAPPQPEQSADLPGFYAPFGSPQLEAWDKTKVGGYPRDKHGGWRFPTEWPPKQEAA
jgi:hypothetical protein